jgi:hypothetical protein
MVASPYPVRGGTEGVPVMFMPPPSLGPPPVSVTIFLAHPLPPGDGRTQ